MCDATHVSRRVETSPRPRRAILYVGTSLAMAGGAAVEAFVAGGALHTFLLTIAATGALATMVIWVRCNRVSLDLEDWCDCARDSMTIRVVHSVRPPHTSFSASVEDDERLDEVAETVTV